MTIYKLILQYKIQLSQSKQLFGKEAELYQSLPNGRIKCTACARLCEIPEGKIGLCGIRGVTNNYNYLFMEELLPVI
jgi:hypothetical protein